MRSRRLPPLLVWLGIAVASAVVIGASFAYAANVGDPLVREEQARRAAPPGTALAPFGAVGPVTPGNSLPTGRATFSLEAFGLDPATTLPPAACLPPLARIASDPAPTVDGLATAWTVAEDCAITQGATPIDLDRFVADPSLQPCVATFLVRETLRLRSPGAATRAIDQLVRGCLTAFVLPGATPQPGTSTSPAPDTGPAPDRVTVGPGPGGVPVPTSDPTVVPTVPIPPDPWVTAVPTTRAITPLSSGPGTP